MTPQSLQWDGMDPTCLIFHKTASQFEKKRMNIIYRRWVWLSWIQVDKKCRSSFCWVPFVSSYVEFLLRQTKVSTQPSLKNIESDSISGRPQCTTSNNKHCHMDFQFYCNNIRLTAVRNLCWQWQWHIYTNYTMLRKIELLLDICKSRSWWW